MGLYKMTEWESNGKYLVGCIDDLGHFSGAWWIPARILNLSLDDYVKMLVNDYHAVIWGWNDYPKEDKRNSLLLFYFNNLLDARAFKNKVNGAAKTRSYMI